MSFANSLIKFKFHAGFRFLFNRFCILTKINSHARYKQCLLCFREHRLQSKSEQQHFSEMHAEKDYLKKQDRARVSKAGRPAESYRRLEKRYLRFVQPHVGQVQGNGPREVPPSVQQLLQNSRACGNSITMPQSMVTPLQCPSPNHFLQRNR